MRRFLAFACCWLAAAWMALGGPLLNPFISFPPAGGGPTFLLSEDFDGTNSTNLSGYNSWTGDSTDGIELSTAQAQSGTGSLKITGSDVAEARKTFTAQTGTFVIDYYFRPDGSNYLSHPHLSNGTFNYGSNNWPTLFRSAVTSLQYSATGGGPPNWTGVGGVTLSNGTWVRLEVEINLATDTMNAWVDGTQRLTGTALRNASSSMDTVGVADNTGGAPVGYIDRLRIYSGTRTP
ncbi:MAG: hypothetical protein QM784_27960 [Polyangiaceae bacterium]